VAGVADDRATLAPGDRVILVVEDDRAFASVLVDLARERGFKAVVASRGERALPLAREHAPAAILLDVHLPGVDGWTILDRLKHDPATRHVPVHVLSVDEASHRARTLGAQAYLEKPVTHEALSGALQRIEQFVKRGVRRLLVVEDDERQRQGLAALLGGADVEVVEATTGAEALRAMEEQPVDCVVLDLLLPDMDGEALLARMRSDPRWKDVPVVLHTGKELTPEESGRLSRLAGRLVPKGAESPQRLLAETSLFLHRVESQGRDGGRRPKADPGAPDALLVGRKVLVVDDDVRNVFAVTSVLERRGMVVRYATSGREAIEVLRTDSGVDAVLMDIMMPDMDGYETMRSIRASSRFATLPIIALTAKAMGGDREKCIHAGANDYLAKPVEAEQLLSLLRVWLL
jgi:CheY-like chemotaxis protein